MRSRLITTQKIIESAADLFLDSGFNNVTMDLIADTAEITKVTVYEHFKSKEVLLLHCLRWRLDSREGSLEAYLRGKGPSSTQVLEVFDWMTQRANKGNFRGCAFLKATNEMGATMPEVRQIALEAKRLIRKRMVRMLRSAGVAHAEAVGDTLALLLEGAQALSLIEQSTRPFKAARREAESLLAQYMSPSSVLPKSVQREN
jgi:AcrR family transcriptional regulator